MVKCDNCGRQTRHVFTRYVKDPEWLGGYRELWICPKCIDLKLELLEWLKGKCLNTMELCRLINGYEKDDFKVCYGGQKFGITRPERCNYKKNGCTFWSFQIYNALRKLEEKGLIHSKKVRFWDRTPLRTDLFRFWFIDPKDFRERVQKQTLEAYL